MIDSAEAANAAIAEASPALAAALSPLGRRAFFPQDIPFQAAQARGKRFNGTIGQITDGRGGAVPLPALAAALSGLPPAARNQALLYSPVEGLPELRRRWREWQRRDLGSAVGEALSTLPLVTAGLTHALALAADLFGGEGRVLALARPFWGNYRQSFGLRTGVRVVSEPAFDGGRFDPRALERSLAGAGLGADRDGGEPALALVNFPSNPGGYSPAEAERRELVESLLRVAEERPLVVLCDDAYAGLVFEQGIPARSLFWDLQGRHPNLVPVKIDGATKELAFFGGRVGFLTFPFAAGSAVEAALESKVKCLVRAGIGSPVAASQVVALQALESGRAGDEVQALRGLLAGRYRALRAALGACDPGLLRPLPFNSGCFALVALGPEARAAGATADRVRRHLLEAEDTGVVAAGEEHLRIAHCSVAEEDLPELVRRLERGVAALARG